VVAEFVAGTGGTASGLAYQILLAGLNLNIPRLFAALLLITLAGVVLFLLVTLLARRTLQHWHESEVAASG
jgi:NitT/TauT family transport system permease protein